MFLAVILFDFLLDMSEVHRVLRETSCMEKKGREEELAILLYSAGKMFVN